MIRRGIVRDGLGIGVATGAYGTTFGAISTAAGLTFPQTMALSLLMFTGASQFALVGVVGSGGSPFSAAATAVLLGTRNAFYGLRLSAILRVRGLRRALAAHFVIDESTAMALAHDATSEGSSGFWAAGLAVFALWNTGTALGVLGAQALSDPRVFGLDAAAPAAFLALVVPRIGSRRIGLLALGAAAIALLSVPIAPAGTPVLLAGVMAIALGWTGALQQNLAPADPATAAAVEDG